MKFLISISIILSFLVVAAVVLMPETSEEALSDTIEMVKREDFSLTSWVKEEKPTGDTYVYQEPAPPRTRQMYAYRQEASYQEPANEEKVEEKPQAKKETVITDKGVTTARDFTRPEIVEAAIECDAKAVRELINRGHDVNSRDYRGYTALAWSAQLNCKQVVDVLLGSGKDIDMITWNGYSASDWASLSGNVSLAFHIRHRAQ